METNFAILSLVSVMLFANCNNPIKNENAAIVNEIDSSHAANLIDTAIQPKVTASVIVTKREDIIGFWVGDFENADEENRKIIHASDEFYWGRQNKINISIDEIKDSIVKGHSVVAGNARPFIGKIIESSSEYKFELKEPGDDKYDGKFNFTIAKNDTLLKGTWDAYKKIDIEHRKYSLQKKIYNYNVNQMLKYSRRYGNWEKSIKEKAFDEEGKEVKGYFTESISGSTNKIYKLNASSTLLKKEDVENLVQGDLLVIRNTIYARHGYSFKARPLRVFFDAQNWYIPVHTNIKAALTDIEKKNIELLLKYEKNAKEYYDYFGRG